MVDFMKSIQNGEDYKEEVDTAEHELLRGNINQAKRILKQIIKNNTSHFKANLLLGQVYLAEENSSKALEVYEKMKEDFPLVPDGYYYLGSIYNLLGQYGKAVEHFNFALGLDQNLLEASIGKAIALCELGGSIEALEVLDKAVEAVGSSEDTIMLYEAKMMIYVEYTAEYQKAKELVERILKLDSKNEVALQVKNALSRS